MSASIHSLAKKWRSDRSADPYTSVEGFSSSASSRWWPYPIIIEQIEAGWSEDFRSALALHLARGDYRSQHCLAAFITLSGKWPETDATAALNLLALAHSCAPSSQPSVDRFVAYAALRCVRQGLLDPRQLVCEEAVNILGGLAPHHFMSATSDDHSALRSLGEAVVSRIDDTALGDLLRHRAESALAGGLSSISATAIGETDVHLMLKDLEPVWRDMASSTGDAPLLAALKAHVAALAWMFAEDKKSAIQVVYVYPAKAEQPTKPEPITEKAWGVIEPWMALVRDFALVGDRFFDFEPIGVSGGSLLVTLAIDADAETNKAITAGFRKDKGAALGGAAEDLLDMLRQRKVRIRVAHVDATLASASFEMTPEGQSAERLQLRTRRLTTHEIPQANEWQRIFNTIDAIAKGEPVTEAALGVTTARQIQYYKAASRILGLISAPADALTRTGWLLHVAATTDDRYVRARAAFEATPCGQAWIEWSNGTKLSDVAAGSAAAFLKDRSELTGDTIGRRANTLEVWLKALREH